MAKKLKTYHTFHKGLHNVMSGKLLPDEALADSLGFNTSKPGEIILLGNGKTQYGTASPTVTTLTPGYGLFLFHSDYIIVYDTDGGAPVVPALKPAPTPTVENTILLIQDDTKTYIYDTVSNVTHLLAIDLSDSTGIVLPVYVNVDGNIIICDGNWVNTASISKMLIYIKRTHFLGIDADAYDSWYVKNFALAQPTRGLVAGAVVSVDDGGGDVDTISISAGDIAPMVSEIDQAVSDTDKYIAVNHTHVGSDFSAINDATGTGELETDSVSPDWTSQAYGIYPPAGAGFAIDKAISGAGGTFSAATSCKVYITFVYENEQETLPFPVNNDDISTVYFTIVAANSIVLIVNATSPYDPRIVGGRVYFKDETSGNDYSNDYHLLCDINLEKGIRKNLTDGYTVWELETSGKLHSTITIDDPTFETYYSINGYQGDIDSITARYKTGVIANRSLYVGNVYVDGIAYGDRMMKSPVNKFSVLPSTSFLDVVVNDGESIVKLVLYGDRILQYKQSNMYVVNIAQAIEFLETSYEGVGVNKPCQVTTTEFGIVSINKNGCWIFTGEGLKSLSEGKIDLSLLDWTNDTPSIGYDFVRNVLVIYCGTDGTTDEFYEYNFVYNNWTSGNTVGLYPATNFVRDKDGSLIYYSNSGTDKAYKHTSTAVVPVTGNILVTKDEFLDSPAVKKDIHKLIFHVKADGAQTIGIYYRKDGETSWTTVNATYDIDTSNIYVVKEVELNIFNIYSIQFKFSLTTALSDTNFGLGSVTIYYSLKEPI